MGKIGQDSAGECDKKVTYEWQHWCDNSEVWSGLLPIGELNNHALSRIASVYCRGDGRFVGAYYYPQSTGNKQGDSVVSKTRRGAQRWIEKQLAKFWEPPEIKS